MKSSNAIYPSNSMITLARRNGYAVVIEEINLDTSMAVVRFVGDVGKLMYGNNTHKFALSDLTEF